MHSSKPCSVLWGFEGEGHPSNQSQTQRTDTSQGVKDVALRSGNSGWPSSPRLQSLLGPLSTHQSWSLLLPGASAGQVALPPQGAHQPEAPHASIPGLVESHKAPVHCSPSPSTSKVKNSYQLSKQKHSCMIAISRILCPGDMRPNIVQNAHLREDNRLYSIVQSFWPD